MVLLYFCCQFRTLFVLYAFDFFSYYSYFVAWASLELLGSSGLATQLAGTVGLCHHT